MKPHDTFLELAAIAIDFPIGEADHARLVRHLAGCPACARSVAGFRADARVIATTPVPGLPDRRGAAILSAALHPSAARGSLRLVMVVALLGLLLLGSLAVGARLIGDLEPNPFVVVPPVVTERATPTPAAPSPAESPAESPAPASESPTPRPAITVTPPVVQAPSSGPGLAAERVARDDGYGTGMALGPAGWMYVALFDGEIPVIPRLRTSTDLVSWAEATPGADGMKGGMNWLLAANASGYVAAGSGLWCSADGRVWSEATEEGGTAGPDAGSVASDGRAFVAWHRAMAAPGIWYSADGCTYEPVQLPDAPALIVDAVAAGPDGGFVIAGRRGETVAALDAIEAESVDWSARPGTQAVWTSPDGRSWTGVAMGPGFEGARITDVATGGPGGGVLASGIAPPDPDGPQVPAASRDLDAAVWRYTDAAGWQQLTGMGAFVPPSTDLYVPDVVATPGRWLVTGADDAGRWGVMAGSDDGTSWWDLPLLELGPDAGSYTIDEAAWLDGQLVFLVNRPSGSPDGAGIVEIWTSG